MYVAGLICLLVIGVIAFNAAKGYSSGTGPTHICANCRSRIRPETRMHGSAGVTFLLLLFFIVPGVIYAIWRGSTRYLACPVCSARNPIPLNTPAAALLADRRTPDELLRNFGDKR